MKIIEERANLALITIKSWLSKVKLVINKEKTEGLVLTRRRCFEKPRIYIDDHEIEIKNEIKYLGVILDTKLKWNKHIDFVVDKAIKRSDAIYRITKNT